VVDFPGRAPDLEELALRAAAHCVVTELFARLDRADVEGVLELYAEDATLEAAEGKSAIRQAILHSSGAVTGTPTAHVVTNVRASTIGDGVVVDYMVVAYALDGPGPYAANVILNQRQILKRSSDGNLRIVEHRVQGYDLSQR
jgi:ketosteroid isomerase-like protein